MSRARKKEEQPWLRYIILPILLLLIGLLLSTLIFPKAAIAPSDGVEPTPTPTPTPPKFVCPSSPWVDCMPGPDRRHRSYQCSPEFLRWATENCSGFQGAAY